MQKKRTTALVHLQCRSSSWILFIIRTVHTVLSKSLRRMQRHGEQKAEQHAVTIYIYIYMSRGLLLQRSYKSNTLTVLIVIIK